MKLYLDPGHGGSDPGAQGNGINEKDIVLDIARHLRDILSSDYKNVDVMMSRSNDRTKGLQERTNEANSWGADYYLSIHCNAFNGSAQGYEDYIHSSLSDSSQTAAYQDIMHDEITNVNELRNRGQKKANFHVLRETAMSALLTENGFIDNEHDAALLKSPSWRREVAQGHVNGLARAFNLERKQDDPSTIFRIIAGSFEARANANERVAFLSSEGIDAFVDSITISGKLWHRVQAGAFSTRENAENHLNTVKNAGIEDAYIVSESS
ncbi:N-acetylmuramoyl-L-alanine amidase [Virgibacillus natechei]|uniref:N-acetylmuramoyl-L-alanine amidase n=1 Tax=Virgibacillus natechei TaxID=1216297 RepID=A0ABS4ILS0_9BACI|nr:N-acetylmuramoyl-L-alanine amidase [Virgibacillus natechei]MBP1971366.1 N-acetylmuramoyl-L-alanine amidase [Virgibacillus natechei]UZD12257.1 N-acetylmuramoyl-L-alanine amidase [Virgibacillus natechei]